MPLSSPTTLQVHGHVPPAAYHTMSVVLCIYLLDLKLGCMKEKCAPIHILTEHCHADKVSYESGDEDATSSKEHLAGVDPFLGPVLDPFVAVSSPLRVWVHQGLCCAMEARPRLHGPGLCCGLHAISGCILLHDTPGGHAGLECPS